MTSRNIAEVSMQTEARCLPHDGEMYGLKAVFDATHGLLHWEDTAMRSTALWANTV